MLKKINNRRVNCAIDRLLSTSLVRCVSWAIVLCTISLPSISQGTSVEDSLISVLASASDDAQKVNVLNDISDQYLEKDYKIALNYSKTASTLAKKSAYMEGLLRANSAIGNIYIHYSLNYYEGLRYLLESLEIAKYGDDKLAHMELLRQIGYIHYSQGGFQKSKEYNEQALTIAQVGKYTTAESEILSQLGALFEEQGELDSALKYYELVLDIEDANDFVNTKPASMLGVARLYFLYDEFDEARRYYQMALEEYKPGSNHRWTAQVLSQLARTNISSGDFETGVENALKGLALAQKHNLKKEIRDNYLVLSEGYTQLGELDKSQESFRAYKEISNSIFSVDKRNEIRMAQLSFDAKLNNKEVERLQQEQEIHNLQLEKQAFTRNIFVIGLILAIITVIFLLIMARSKNRINKELTTQKNELEKVYQDTKLLGEIGSKVNQDLSVDSIAASLYSELNQVMDADIFAIGLYSKKFDGIVFKGAYEEGKVLDDFIYGLDEDNLAVKCFKTATRIEIKDWKTEYKQHVEGEYKVKQGKVPTSLIYLPLIVSGKTIGVITVQSLKRNSYNEHDVNILGTVAGHIASSLENARLHENLERSVVRRTKEITYQKQEIEKLFTNTELLSNIGQQITSTLNFETIFENLQHHINELMDAEVFGVRIYHPDKNQIEYKYEIESGERYETQFIPMDDDDNYSVWCIKNRDVIFINDNKKEHTKYVKEIKVPSGEMPNSLLFAPMMVGERVIGVITVQSFKHNAYSTNHLHILKTLASYTGIALDNAALYENLEEKVLLRTEQVEQQKEELIQTNKDITDSISYGQRIQKGLLPTGKYVKQLLPESFIVYEPKDIVSGDFYWIDQKDDKLIVAVVDCTGHGVPGAFMSIVSNNLLNQAVIGKGVVTPSLILDYLQYSLNATFGQGHKTSDQVNDGMDISLCSIDLENNKLLYAGAHNPLYRVREGELTIVKGNTQGISAQAEPHAVAFEDCEVDLKKGDSLYLFSDGYPDQFGGKRNRKFGYRRLREMFIAASEMEIEDQQILVEQQLKNWKGKVDQVDDVCVVGIRV